MEYGTHLPLMKLDRALPHSVRCLAAFGPNVRVSDAQADGLTAGSTVVAASSTCRGSSPSGQRYTRSQPASA